MGERKSKKPKPRTVALAFKELLLQNGFICTVPGPMGDLKVAFSSKGQGTYFVAVNPYLRDCLFNAGFLATIVEAIYGPTAFFYPVHGRIQLVGPKSHGGANGATRFEAVENLLQWRAEQLNKDASTVSLSGAVQLDPTGDAPSAVVSTVSG